MSKEEIFLDFRNQSLANGHSKMNDICLFSLVFLHFWKIRLHQVLESKALLNDETSAIEMFFIFLEIVWPPLRCLKILKAVDHSSSTYSKAWRMDAFKIHFFHLDIPQKWRVQEGEKKKSTQQNLKTWLVSFIHGTCTDEDLWHGTSEPTSILARPSVWLPRCHTFLGSALF